MWGYTREPGAELIDLMERRGAVVDYHDPYGLRFPPQESMPRKQVGARWIFQPTAWPRLIIVITTVMMPLIGNRR